MVGVIVDNHPAVGNVAFGVGSVRFLYPEFEPAFCPEEASHCLTCLFGIHIPCEIACRQCRHGVFYVHFHRHSQVYVLDFPAGMHEVEMYLPVASPYA